MKYYKTPSGDVRAIEKGQESLIETTWVQMTNAEVDAVVNPPLTPEQQQQSENERHRAYLAETDWYVVRFAETGTPIPDDIRARREAARAAVVE